MAKKNELEILLVARDKATKDIKRSLNGIENATNKAEKKVSSSFNKMGISARKLMNIIGVAGLLFAFKKVIDTAVEFESAFAGVRKTVEATEAEFAQLRDGLIELSTKIPVAVTELAKIQEIAGQLGITGVADLTSFTEAVAKIGVTTNLTVEDAAISFARIASIIGEPISQIERMASVVVDLGNKFEVNEREIVTFATRIAGAGKVAGLTSKDIFGIGAAMASVGIQAESGGTAVQKVLLDLQGQGKKGIGAFVKFVRDLEEAGDGANAMLEEMGFNNERVKRAFLSLAVSGGKFEQVLKVANKAYEENIALNIEAEKRFSTTASKTQLAKNEFAKLSIEMGEVLLPAINKILSLFNSLITTIEKTAHALGTVTLKIQDFLLSQGGFNEDLQTDRTKAGLARIEEEDGPLGGDDTVQKAQETVEALNVVTEGFKLKTIKTFKDIGEKTVSFLKKTESFNVKIAKLGATAVTKFSDSFGTAMSQALILGKDFGKTMEQMFVNFAAQAVASLISIITQVLILRALGVVGPISTQQLGASGGGNFLSNLLGLADGGIVNKPTVALIGERGPEAVVPLNGNSGIGTTINIEINNPNFRDEENLQTLVEEISDAISRETERL